MQYCRTLILISLFSPFWSVVFFALYLHFLSAISKRIPSPACLPFISQVLFSPFPPLLSPSALPYPSHFPTSPSPFQLPLLLLRFSPLPLSLFLTPPSPLPLNHFPSFPPPPSPPPLPQFQLIHPLMSDISICFHCRQNWPRVGRTSRDNSCPFCYYSPTTPSCPYY